MLTSSAYGRTERRYYWLDTARARGYTRLPRLLPSCTRTLKVYARMSLARPWAGQESPRESRSYRATLKIHRTLQHKDKLPTQLLPRRWPAPTGPTHTHTPYYRQFLVCIPALVSQSVPGLHLQFLCIL